MPVHGLFRTEPHRALLREREERARHEREHAEREEHEHHEREHAEREERERAEHQEREHLEHHEHLATQVKRLEGHVRELHEAFRQLQRELEDIKRRAER